MYVCYIEEIPKKYYKLNNTKFKDNIYLTSAEEINNIIEFINKFGVSEYKKIFDKLDIKYNSIESNGLTYTINNKLLPICKLSSGERMLLYSYIMDKLNKTLILIGLMDRMDLQHRNILYNNLGKSKYLIVFIFDYTTFNQDFVDAFYKPFKELQEEGVL